VAIAEGPVTMRGMMRFSCRGLLDRCNGCDIGHMTFTIELGREDDIERSAELFGKAAQVPGTSSRAAAAE
jgi:hypothetical protein